MFIPGLVHGDNNAREKKGETYGLVPQRYTISTK